jgi:TRAP transporter 4TM/12TM fusion protein
MSVEIRSFMHTKLTSIAKALLVVTSVYAIYANVFSLLSPIVVRGGYWGLIAMAVFLLSKGKEQRTPIKLTLDIVLALLTGISTAILVLRWEAFASGLHDATFLEEAAAIVMVFLVLEATRRIIGWFLGAVTILFLVYAFFGNYAPGILVSRAYSVTRVTTFLFWGTKGIYGLPMYIAASYVMLFVIFGALLLRCGGEKWFMDLSFAAVGKIRGGPALTSVISSAIFGMMSGSPVANVVTTGSFTIPLMKEIGFKKHVAAAIEAVSSTAGMFTPPIMGAAAFLMAEYVEVPYIKIVCVAAIPAFLFYVSLMATVYIRSVKMEIPVLKTEDITKLTETLKTYGHLIPPIFLLLVLLLMGWSLMWSAFWAIVSLVGLAMMRKVSRMSLSDIIFGLEDAAQKALPVAVACAAAGIIYGIISLTGLGFRVSSALMTLAGQTRFMVLLFTMFSGILLGFAMPPTAAYIILAALIVPSLQGVGFPLIVAHMFIFFFCSIGPITPPVALAAYSAAGIAGSDPNKTGFMAFRLGLAAFIIPFLFSYTPQLLLVGRAFDISWEVIKAMLVLFAIVVVIEGFLVRALGPFYRILFLICACMILYPHPSGNIAGVLLFVLLVLPLIVKKGPRRGLSSFS